MGFICLSSNPFFAPFCTAENVELKAVFLIFTFSKTPAVTEVPPTGYNVLGLVVGVEQVF